MADDVAKTSGQDLACALPVLLINLDGSEDRLRKATGQLEAAGLRFERLPAVDGRKLPAAELDRLAPWDRRAFFKPLSPGEIGCYLSHLAALERIVKEGWPRALVLEDDFVLEPGFRAALAEVLSRSAQADDMIKLEGLRSGGEVVARLHSGRLLKRNRRPPTRNVAHIWSLEGARKVLRATGTLRRPFDVEIKHWWESGIEIAYASPPLIRDGDPDGTGSTIGARQPGGLAIRLRKIGYRWGFFFQSNWHYLRRWGWRSWLRVSLG
jgi:glycosyl transferase family 25